MKTFYRSFFLTFLILVLVCFSFAIGYLFNEYFNPSDVSFTILSEAYDLVLRNGYASPPPLPALEYGMIRGMLDAYGDPYTTFIEPAQHELESDSLQGSFGGIGADLGIDPQGFIVLFPFPNSPASLAGILEGDRLVGVDNLSVTSTTSTDILLAAIRGPVGEPVIIRIARPPQYLEFEFTLIRQEILLPSVTWHLEPTQPRLGVIQVNIIASTSHDEILNAVNDLQRRGASAFVLDLRDNYGGLLDAGIDIARLFLTSGIIIEQQYRHQPIETFSVDQPVELENLPLVVLVNQNTASAAEIIAGSLQAHQRAILIGVPTYGKDTIQLVYELEDGSSLHVTAAHWWIPGNEGLIAGNGLQPNITPQIAPNAIIDPFIQAAITYLFNP
jgi:carboxyl-terminal processing protease